jgi:hypothetical protein
MPPFIRRNASAFLIVGLLFSVPALASGQGARQQPPVLTAFSIDAGADSVSSSDPSVTLTHAVVGERPSEYRVSHRADFAGAQWMPYATPLSIRNWYDRSAAACTMSQAPHVSRRVTLYLQVRAKVGQELRIADGQRQLVPSNVESNVLRATICARSTDANGAAPGVGETRRSVP